MANNRKSRINEEILRELSVLIRTLKDPRITGLVSITHVDVTPDMRYARVFVSRLGDDRALNDCIKGLKSAGGYLRRELASRLTIRYTPELVFVADDSITHGAHIMELLEGLDIGKDADSNDD